MATYTQSWRNHVWLAWFALQVPIVLLIDAMHFYPSWLYKPASSPLHFAEVFRQDYIATYNDPFMQWSAATAAGHDSWIGLFLYLEFAFSVPIVVYALYRLGVQRKGTSGADELLLLVYAFETALTTLTCIHDVSYWDPAVYSAELKQTFQLNFLGPWLLMPTLMFVDMVFRILARIKVADAAVAGKKGQ
ncbi:transmembrane protein 6/97 [Podospora appendiculata]|uniref:Efficient mitochondria targeting-associated protein 19 n=1 Tax=Podospora appendiculata TaxID=314037 RepID=A0AAE1CB83_9PEZI|nr:transmembrane protein 6/97 [Podospora appendiculata]